MKNIFKGPRTWLITLMSFLAIAAMGTIYASDGLLDGKKFAGETGEKGKSKGDKEGFVFADGKYDPVACHKYGFLNTSYSAKAEGDTIAFVAEHSSNNGDRMRWEGAVKGEKLEGVMMYWQGKKTPQEYWFRGTLINQK